MSTPHSSGSPRRTPHPVTSGFSPKRSGAAPRPASPRTALSSFGAAHTRRPSVSTSSYSGARPASPYKHVGSSNTGARSSYTSSYSSSRPVHSPSTRYTPPSGSGASSRYSSPRPSYGARPSYGSRGGYGASRPSFGGRPGGYAGGSRGGGRRGPSGYRFNTSQFINKSVVNDPTPVFIPKHTFFDFKIDERLKAVIAVKGLVTPTPIQDASIPEVLAGKDVVGIANTGTGKTAAFLIPLIDKILRNPKEKVLIMAPTRELAIQIDDELKTLSKGMKIFSVCCVGGANIRKQMSELRYFNNFIIGTPGRLKDLGERKYVNFKEFNNAVLDEADRMLDMGFIADMKFMLGQMPKTRQTLFFTATMSTDIQKLIKDFLNDPQTISVKTGDTAKSVDQDVVRVGGSDKVEVLRELLGKEEFNKVLVFGQTKHGVEKLSIALAKFGFKAGSIHGNKNHTQRQRTLKDFKEGRLNILVATDVAARGLDIADVSHVINYDLPMTYEDYVHRIGRTGRAGRKGKALTFVS